MGEKHVRDAGPAEALAGEGTQAPARGHGGPHHHSHHHHHHGEAQGNIRLAFLLNLSFSLIELAGGVLTNSVAILSDSVHDFGDALVLGSSWLFERKAQGEADATHSYGYRRYSTVGALVTTLVLLIGSAGVIAGAVPRIISPVPVDEGGMLVLAVLGVAMNGLAAWRTSGGMSLNERAVNLHMLEDVLGWAAVLVGAAVMRLTGWYAIDPILSVAIALSIARGAVLNLMKIVPVFLDEVPSGISIDSLIDIIIEEVDGVSCCIAVSLSSETSNT